MFSISRHNIQKYPNSYFGELLENGVPEDPIFIDRNPQFFNFIIEFMRNDDWLMPFSFGHKKRLLADIEYYRLPPPEVNNYGILTGSVINAVELKFVSNFDKNGLFYYLGTDKNINAEHNPNHIYKYINITCGPVVSTSFDVKMLVTRKEQVWQVQTKKGWFQIILNHMRLCLHKYTIRQRNDYDGWAMRNWTLYGMDEEDQWVTIKVHENDDSIKDQRSSLASWDINYDQYFKGFKIYQHGPHSGNSEEYFNLSNIEFYGNLLELEE